MESDSDEEIQIQELQQLHAVLEADESTSNECSSRFSSSLPSIVTSNPSISEKGKDEYVKIQKALALNKVTDEKMRRLEGILIARLRECRQKLSEIQNHQTSLMKTEKQNSFRYINCAKPYFKDPNGFPPPENEDTITIRESGMYDFSEVSSVAGWTVKDKSEFLKQILKMTKDLKRKEINSEIAQLKRDMKVKDSKTIPQEIAKLKKKLDGVNKMVLNEETALPIDQEYDWDAVAASMNRRHSPQEYQALWKLYLHPSINKSNWNKSEHSKLQELAHAHKLQDWDQIARELKTGRTGYQCFVYFKTNMSNSFTGQKWTKEEEEYLRRLIDYYREDDYIPWGKVAASIENRTKIQIYNKYLRLMEQRKGRFLPEEDAVLLTCIETFGPIFRKVMKYLPGRSSQQLRMRYHVLKNKTRTSMVWTADEDKKLIQLMSNQDCSVNFAALTKHFPNKNRVQLRARYVTLVKWIKKHPNKDISRAPRRGARRLGHGQSSEDLNKAVENLKKRIQSEVEIKKSKRITKNSPEDVIEDAIIATLVTEHVRDEELKKLCDNVEMAHTHVFYENSMTNNDTDLKNLLIMLKAKLNKERFSHSQYATQYPKLTEEEVNVTFKMKSYTRKSQINITKQTSKRNNESPDIWGQSLNYSEYVFPPHYATITGCKRFMAYTSVPYIDRTTTLQTMIKRNVLLREQVNIFVERFCTLFLWPILLSNEEPQFRPMVPAVIEERILQQRERLCGIDTTVPIPNWQVEKNYDNADTIDLDTSREEEFDHTVIKPCIDIVHYGGLSNLR